MTTAMPPRLKHRRSRQEKRLLKGAVTPSYAADRERVLKLLDGALATEILCGLRYRRHHAMAQGLRARPAAAEFLEHARQEEEHARRIAQRIVQLGGEPDFAPDNLTRRSHARYVEGETLREMIIANLESERIAVDQYREMIREIGDDDPTTRRMLEDVLASEEEHADDMAGLLEDSEFRS